MNLILASQSPRRRKLLADLGFTFETFEPNIDETLDLNIIDTSILTIAKAKATTARQRFDQGLAIGCDTIVQLGSTCFGKPSDRADARHMLEKLSGQTHIVKSALVLLDLSKGNYFSDLDQTEVTFRKLGAAEIEAYLDGPEPYDKAGAYALQGQGGVLIEKINGCINNVIGFPVTLFLKLKQAAEGC